MALAWITERPEREADVSAQRNNLLYEIISRKYKREFNIKRTTSRDTSVDVLATPGLPVVGQAYPYDPLATCVRVMPRAVANSRQWWRVVCEYDTDRIVNAITDNPLNQPPEIAWSGALYTKSMRRDLFGIPYESSSRNPYDTVPEIEDTRAVLSITRNEASFDEAYAKLWRRRLNQYAFAGYPSLCVRINQLDGVRQFVNGVLFFQVRYELEFREEDPLQPIDSFVEYVADKDFRDIDKNIFRDERDGSPLTNETYLNGRGKAIREVRTPLVANITNVQTTLKILKSYDDVWFPPSKKAANVDGIIPGPDWNFQIKLEDEIMIVTGRATVGLDSEFTIIRGCYGTTAAAHVAGTTITLEPYFRRYINNKYANFATLSLPVL